MLGDNERTIRSALILGAHSAPCHFADLDTFVDAILARLSVLPKIDSTASALSSLRELYGRLRDVTPIDAGSAYEVLLGNDLRAILDALDGLDLSLEMQIDVDAILDQATRELERLGLQPRYQPLVSVVDTFPSPFEGADWSAMAPDEDDLKRYGIEPGIYFRRDRAYPVFVQTTIAHELIHCVPRDIVAGTFGMGLEEGLCDLIGFMQIGAALVGHVRMRRAFVYYRLSPKTPTLRRLYVDHDRLALSILHRAGIDGLAKLLREGRVALRAAEALFLNGGTTVPQVNNLRSLRAHWPYHAIIAPKIAVPSTQLAAEGVAEEPL